MNDHVKRILEMSNYDPKKGKLVENFINTGLNEDQGIDPNFDQELNTALDQVMRTLPQAISNFANQSGDRDGQLVPVNIQTTNEEVELDEAVGALIAGAALAVPAIGNLIGKTISFLGKKADSATTQKIGQYIEKKAHALHHKYEHIIDKALSPVTKFLDEKKRKMVNKIVFYSIIGVLGGAGAVGAVKAAGAGNVTLAAVESGLSGVKASEIIAAAKDVIPRVLAQFVK